MTIKFNYKQSSNYFQCPDQSDQHNFKAWHEIRQQSWSIWSPLFQSHRWSNAYIWLDWAGHFYTQTWTCVWYDWVVQLQSKTWSHDHPWEAWAVQDGTLIWPHEVMIILISSFTTQTDSHTALINLNSWVTNLDIDLFTNLISMRWLFAESDMKWSTSLNILMILILNQYTNFSVLPILWSICKAKFFKHCLVFIIFCKIS